MNTRSILSGFFYCIALFGSTVVFSQNEFDKYGPFGSEVHKDLKQALQLGRGVYKMDLSYQQIDPKIFEKITSLTDLQALKLSGNGITEFPNGFDQLFNLTYLASYNNKLNRFPPRLQAYRNLQCLDLQHTNIDSIPAAIAFLGRLQTLKFGNTDDTLKLPTTLPYLKYLRDLAFENCVLDSFPKELFKLSKVSYLYLSNTNTSYLTKHFERMPDLEVLVVENNPIKKLPFEIYKAQKLRIISLRGTQVTRVPDSISQLESLTILDLRGTKLPVEEIEKLRALLPGCEVKF